MAELSARSSLRETGAIAQNGYPTNEKPAHVTAMIGFNEKQSAQCAIAGSNTAYNRGYRRSAQLKPAESPQLTPQTAQRTVLRYKNRLISWYETRITKGGS